MKRTVDYGRYTVIDEDYMLVKVVPNTSNECCVISRYDGEVLASANNVKALTDVLREFTNWTIKAIKNYAESYIEY